MIQSFADKETEKFFITGKSKKIPGEIQKRALHKLDRLDAIIDVNELRVPPSNRLPELSGDLSGMYSISINDQYRLIFKFADKNAFDVQIIDYH